jgi:hypothetical protein
MKQIVSNFKCNYFIINNKMIIYVLTITICFLFYIYEADFYSGLLHIVFDNEMYEHDIFLGGLVKHFLNHHKNPLEMTKRLLPVTIITLPPVLLMFILTYIFNLSYWNTTIICLLALSGNFSHAFAHGLHKNNYIVKMLINSKLSMTPYHHSQHHHTFDKNFCICSGWANPLLNRLYQYKTLRSLDRPIFYIYTFLRLFITNYIFTCL